MHSIAWHREMHGQLLDGSVDDSLVLEERHVLVVDVPVSDEHDGCFRAREQANEPTHLPLGGVPVGLDQVSDDV